MLLLIVIPYSLTYIWEKRDIKPQSWDRTEHHRDRPDAKLPLSRTKKGRAEIKKWDGHTLYIKEEVNHDD
jgi:hypothetical protein